MKKIFKVFMIGMILSGLLVSCKNNTDEPKNDVDTEQSGGKDENQNTEDSKDSETEKSDEDVTTPEENMDGALYYATWASSQYLAEPNNQPPMALSGNSIRQTVHASVGGDYIRVKFSNLVGNGTLKIKEARIALAKSGSSIDTASDTLITFNNGKTECDIGAGGEIWSDKIKFSFKDLDCLTVSTYFGDVPSNITGHMGSRTNSYMVKGKHVSDESYSGASSCEHWYILAGIDVLKANPVKVISCLGDSITDGRGSTTDKQNRWTDILSERLLKNESTKNLAVINEGIGGTCVTTSGADRFDRDVLGNAGVSYAVILYGINDIIYMNSSADQIIKTYKSMIKKAHRKNVIVYGATILPFGNCNDYTAAKDDTRKKVNEWIKNTKTVDGGFDGFVDIAAIMADSSNPKVMSKAYDSGDGLHPGAAGYKAMGEAFDLALFEKSVEEASKKWPSADASGKVTIENTEMFKYKLPQTVTPGQAVYFELKGVNNSATTGFRVWTTDASGSANSNVVTHEKSGDFTLTGTLTPTTNCDYLLIKGIRYGVNIESLTLTACSVKINGKTTEIEIEDYM